MIGDFGFLHAVFAPVQPAGFRCSIRTGGEDGHHIAHASAVVGGRRGQARDGKLRSCQGFAGQLVAFHDSDFPRHDIIGKRDIGCVSRRDGNALRVGHIEQIPLRRDCLPHRIHAGVEIGERGDAIRFGGLRLYDRAQAVQQLKDRARQRSPGSRALLGRGNGALRHVEGDSHRLELVGRAVLRNQHLLNGHAWHADQEIGFLVRRGNGFRGNRQAVARCGYRDGIAAVQIVVGTIRTSGISRYRPCGCGDADEVCVR